MIQNHTTPAAALWMKYQELHEKQLSENPTNIRRNMLRNQGDTKRRVNSE